MKLDKCLAKEKIDFAFLSCIFFFSSALCNKFVFVAIQINCRLTLVDNNLMTTHKSFTHDESSAEPIKIDL